MNQRLSGLGISIPILEGHSAFPTRFGDQTLNGFAIFERAKHGTLLDMILKLKSSSEHWEETLRYLVRSLASLLAQLKAAGVSHLDIKPDNIAVTEVNGKVVLMLIDFGTSAPIKSTVTSMKGTWCYMAPEIFECSESQPADPEKADVFSFGATILALVLQDFPLSEPHEQGQSIRESAVYKARVDELPESNET